MPVPFDQISIINLRSRADRRREMMGELDRLGLKNDPRVEFFEAIAPTDRGKWHTIGEHGCFLSHLAVLKSAAAEGKSLLLLEDDCDFTAAALTSDWGAGSDIFYGGYSAADYSQLQTSDLQGAHCVGFSHAGLAPLVAYLEQQAAGEAPAPVDGAYVDFRRANPQVRTAFAQPQVAIQRQSSSDISPGRFDRNAVTRFAVSLVRKLNRGRNRRRKLMDGQ